MLDKEGLLPCDPRGLIHESFRIDGISPEECRSIFFDWALSNDPGPDMRADVAALLDHYGARHARHPMIAVLTEGLPDAVAPRRRGGRRARVEPDGDGGN